MAEDDLITRKRARHRKPKQDPQLFPEKKEEIKKLAFQALLPFMSERTRLIPNSFIRSAMFGVVRKGRREMVKDYKIVNFHGYEINYTGELLDQNDLSVWDSLVFLAKEKKIEENLLLTMYELSKFMGYSDNKSVRTQLWARIKRLQNANVEIINTQKRQHFLGHLIHNAFVDKESGKSAIIFDKYISGLFVGDYTRISVDIRRELGESQLARWLYNFFESHKTPTTNLPVERLKELCRSVAELKKFRQSLKIALAEVERSCTKWGRVFKWDYDIISDTIAANLEKIEKPTLPAL